MQRMRKLWRRLSIRANADSLSSGKLPDGYDTVLTQDGAGISQGAKTIDRHCSSYSSRDPAILILDEATSNIDTETELKIQEALANI